MNKKIYYTILAILLPISIYQVINFSFENYFWCVLPIGILIVWLWSRKDIIDIIDIIGWFTNKKMPPARPIKESTSIQDVDFETQRKTYMELAKLCCSAENQAKILPFLANLKESQDGNDYDILDTIIEFLTDNDCLFIVSLDWKQEVEDLQWYLNAILEKNYNGLVVDFPKYDDGDFLHDVFERFNEALKKHDLQFSLIDTQSDEYVFVVHKVCDREKVIQLMHRIGYYSLPIPQKSDVEIFETQQKACTELTKLCCSVENQAKILPFLSNLKYEEYYTTYNHFLEGIIEFLDKNDYPFIVHFAWNQELEDLEGFLHDILATNYDGLIIDFPKYNEDDTFADVLDDFNHCLKKHDLQMGFIEMDSTDYVFVVHKVCDKEKVEQLIDNIGYYYFETGEEHAEIQKRIEEERLAAIPSEYDVKSFLFWLVILLLCPFFTYVTYRGFLKDGFSFWVIFIGITNLGFYYWSIVSIVGEFSLYRKWKERSNFSKQE